MLGISAIKWVLVFVLFVVLPIAMMRYMVHRTIKVRDKVSPRD